MGIEALLLACLLRVWAVVGIRVLSKCFLVLMAVSWTYRFVKSSSFDDSEDMSFVFRADVEKVFCEGLSCMEMAM